MRRIRAIEPWLVRGASAIALASVLCGCSHTVVVGSDRTLTLALTEYRVIPQSVQATSGLLTIIVHNEGRLTHNLALSRNGRIVAETPPVASGASADLAISLAPGSYLMASTLFSDQVLGEYGTLTVSS